MMHRAVHAPDIRALVVQYFQCNHLRLFVKWHTANKRWTFCKVYKRGRKSAKIMTMAQKFKGKRRKMDRGTSWPTVC